MKYLTEDVVLIHGFGPGRVVGKIDDIDLYTSDKLVEDFSKSIDELLITDSLIAPLLKLSLEKKILIPCTVKSNSFSLLYDKILMKIPFIGKTIQTDIGVVAFYTPNQDKIFLIMDSSHLHGSKILMDYTDKSTISIICHEFSHYISAHTDPNVYYNSFDFLGKFYNNLYNYYVNYLIFLQEKHMISYTAMIQHCSDVITAKKIHNEVLEKLDTDIIINETKDIVISFLMNENVKNKKKDMKDILKTYEHFMKIIVDYAKTDPKGSKEILKMALMSRYITQRMSFVISSVYLPIYYSYKKVFGNNFINKSNSYYGQELIFPSEVVAMYSGFVIENENKSKIKKHLNILTRLVKNI